MSLEVVSDTPAPVPAKEVEVLVDQEKEEVAEKAVPTKRFSLVQVDDDDNVNNNGNDNKQRRRKNNNRKGWKNNRRPRQPPQTGTDRANNASNWRSTYEEQQEFLKKHPEHIYVAVGYHPPQPVDPDAEEPEYLPPQPIMVPLMEVLTQQLEYYFSVENLCRDIFLRGKMNGKGYIDIDVLGSFNRLRYLTDNIDFLLKAARKSELLKVKNRAVRARKNWHQWTFPPQLDMMNEPDSSDEEVEEEETETETPQEQEQSKEQTQEQEEEKEAVSDKGDEKEHLNVKEVAKEENTETEPEKAATITTTEKKEEEKTDDTEVESK